MKCTLPSKIRLGAVAPQKSLWNPESTGSCVSIDTPNHGAIGLLVWRMEGDDRSPEKEAFAREVVRRYNEYEKLVNELKTLSMKLGEINGKT